MSCQQIVNAGEAGQYARVATKKIHARTERFETVTRWRDAARVMFRERHETLS